MEAETAKTPNWSRLYKRAAIVGAAWGTWEMKGAVWHGLEGVPALAIGAAFGVAILLVMAAAYRILGWPAAGLIVGPLFVAIFLTPDPGERAVPLVIGAVAVVVAFSVLARVEKWRRSR